ncbi:MAG: F0F1 ATP synthase subunit epsilon [Gammaproteobacteria bacterium]|nr:F0F1 ATP synthase subunit epsilon [Gammaproteobacteria bacterium]MCY4011159.1 F0F1 ATP synthase subunit epsilon [Gammaproteobacteria bacterium]
MAATMQCYIVSAEEEIYSGRVAMLSATGTIGELGILPGHAPLLTGIRPGPVKLRDENGEEDVFFASGGYLEIQPGIVTVLADTALRADDIDEAAAIEARQEAERALSEAAAELDYGRVEAQLAAASAQQRTLDELRKIRR